MANHGNWQFGIYFDGLVGKNVTVQVEKGTGVLYVINGKDYRYADGSFAEYYEPFTGEPLGSMQQSWTAAAGAP